MSLVKFTVASEIDDNVFKEHVRTVTPLLFTAQPAGVELYKLLCSAFGTKIRMVETGCLRDTDPSAAFSDGWSTLYLAKYASETGSKFTSIESDPNAIFKCLKFLKEYDLTADFIKSESPKALRDTPADFYFLDSCDGLEHGLEEFKAAMYHEPKMIVMDDFETKAELAFQFATDVGIKAERMDRYTVFTFRL